MQLTAQQQTEIYENYNKKVLSYIRNKVSDSYLAEDLCADVFVKVYEKYSTFDSKKASISTWIYTIAHNVVIDHYRKARPFEEVSEDIKAEDDPFLEVCNSQQLDSLAGALKKLDAKERHIIIGRYYYDKSLKDLAEEMCFSYSYVKVIHSNALKKLKDLLA